MKSMLSNKPALARLTCALFAMLAGTIVPASAKDPPPVFPAS
jgi:hypothetical protein